MHRWGLTVFLKGAFAWNGAAFARWYFSFQSLRCRVRRRSNLGPVDATRTQQKLLHTHLVMPVKPGPLTLYYPKWIPGEHGLMDPRKSDGPQFEANGQTIPCRLICWMFSPSTWKSHTGQPSRRQL